MNDKKVIYIDLETGGPDPRNTCLLQISGAIEINWEIKEKFNTFLIPFPDDPEITAEATEKHGITKEMIAANEGNRFIDPKIVFEEFKKMLGKYVDPFNKTDKFIFVGYNCHAFDEPCLRQFFLKNDDKYFGSWFWYPTVDVMHQYMSDWWSIRDQIPNFRLETIAGLKGIPVEQDKLHDGLYDIQLTRELFIRREREMQNMRRVFGQVQQKLAQQAQANQEAVDQAAAHAEGDNVPPKQDMN